MNITVYCGSAYGADPAFQQGARELGTWMAKNGHTLVYGGAASGLMGEIADAVLQGGGKAIGILPDVLVEREPPHEGLTEFYQVKSMTERKAMMIDFGEVFVAMPGGPGTLEELSEILSLDKIEILKVPCILFNINGYFDALVEVYDRMFEHGFMDKDNRSLLVNACSVAEIGEYLSR